MVSFQLFDILPDSIQDLNVILLSDRKFSGNLINKEQPHGKTYVCKPLCAFNTRQFVLIMLRSFKVQTTEVALL